LAAITTWWNQAATGTSARSASRFYHPELDILRFFAFLGVFCHHALPHEVSFYSALGVPLAISTVLASAGATGAFGVDLFFTLSAYLITELLLREKELLGTLDIKAFYVRRILRIWPLYFFFLLLVVCMTYFIAGQQLGWRATIAFTFLSGNWWIVFRGFPSSVVFPLWSVSIEEQFYLLWPVAARRVKATGMAVIAVAMLLVATVSRLYLVQHGSTESQIWCNTFARLDPIAVGILAAVILRGGAPRWTVTGRAALLTAGATMLGTAAIVCQLKYDPLTTARVLVGYPLAALGAVAVLLATLNSRTVLAKSAFVYLGKVSYGLYVFHVLGLMLSDLVVPRGYSSFSLYLLKISTALAITIAFAAMSFRWIERPFLLLKSRFTLIPSRSES
jgi:peptidoglycan/LPS O-acetylase OafA/YrhL